MSYDFMMMKPKVEIRSPNDIDENTLLEQDPDAVIAALSAMLPGLAWRRESDGRWFASHDGEDTWCEFNISSTPDLVWHIRMSHRTRERSLIASICKALGLIAFDGQAMAIVSADGERSA